MISDAKEKAKSEYDRIVADAQLAIQQQKKCCTYRCKKSSPGNLVIEVAEKF